jgi:hypothetical protein
MTISQTECDTIPTLIQWATARDLVRAVLLTSTRAIPDAPTMLAELDAGYRVLLDKDQLTVALRPPTFTAYVPQQPSLLTYQTLINDFLSDAPYVAKCLWCDELLPAKWCLDDDMKHNYLR